MENIMIKVSKLQDLNCDILDELQCIDELLNELQEGTKVSICSQIKDNFLYFINKKCKLL
tara:strand:- start:7 stop:186 length:180 start_codon:yes stop_codon:yes gene_type:complete